MHIHLLTMALGAVSFCCLSILAADSEEFMTAIQKGDTDKVAAMLGRQPQLANAQRKDGASAVLFALYTRHRDIADLLISRGATIGFAEACALGQFERVKAALQEDPSRANQLSADGFPPLGLATYFGHHDVVILLLAQHADPSAQSRNQIQVAPLHAAVERQDQTLVEILLSHGADPNVPEFLGGTPLHTAAMSGADSIVRMLVLHGADTGLKMKDGRTAQELAATAKHAELAEWLAKQSGKKGARF
ncbi:MAG TPA: ankyrin repeat domain-containing protein [Bryobacteraceae bacterium]|nr:ankyrin repeat domain-containing protein [Bryobacteraceae bacterium]